MPGAQIGQHQADNQRHKGKGKQADANTLERRRQLGIIQLQYNHPADQLIVIGIKFLKIIALFIRAVKKSTKAFGFNRLP